MSERDEVAISDLGYVKWPTAYTVHFKLFGRDFQIYCTFKTKKLRIFIDHKEWKVAGNEVG